MQPSGNGDWFLDSGATSHITGNAGNLAKIYSLSKINSPSIVVGNGSHLPVTASGSSFLTSRPFHINNVLVAPLSLKIYYLFVNSLSIILYQLSLTPMVSW